MISRERALSCLEAEATKLRCLSYEELEEFARSRGILDDWHSQELLVDGQIIYVNTMIGKLGRIRKRISVEINLSAEGSVLPADLPFRYFERYESGRIYPSAHDEAIEAAVFKALRYVLFGVVVIALVALARSVFL